MDPFEFILAEALGLTLSQVRALPNAEFMEWRAFWVWRQAMEDFEARRAQERG